ncbi:5299_t:CDS:2, partial [Dentiscutata erythropus]
MPCCIDTIVKIVQVRQTDRDESNFTVVWALGVYPVESEDHEMEITLFVPINEVERDPNAQSVFVKSKYYSVCGKVVPGVYNGKFRLKMTALSSTHFTLQRDLGSNRCSLKASLVGIAQDFLKEIDNESAMFKLSVNDYAGKNYSFVINIIFPHLNSRFKYLMNSVHSNESVLFIVGHLEVFKEDLYLYAADTSFVDFCSNVVEKLHQALSVEADKFPVDSATIGFCSRHTRSVVYSKEDVGDIAVIQMIVEVIRVVVLREIR